MTNKNPFEPGRGRLGSRPVTEAQRSLWFFNLSQGFFDADSYLQAPYKRDHEFADVWYSDLGLNAYTHIPGIPKAYQYEWAEERSVFLWGVPNSVDNAKMIDCLKDFGTIESLPMIIDFVSKDTFRFVIMSNNEEANRVVKLFHLAKVPFPIGHHGTLVGLPALAPNRGVVREIHLTARNFKVGGTEELEFGYKQELGPGRSLPERPYYDMQRSSRFEQTFINRGQSMNVPSGLTGASAFGYPPLPPVLSSYQTPVQKPIVPQNVGYSRTPGLGVFDTPSPHGLGSTIQTPIFETPSKASGKIDRKGKGKALDTTDDETQAQESKELEMTDDTTEVQPKKKRPDYTHYGAADDAKIAEIYGSASNPNPYYNANPFNVPARPQPADPLVALLRKNVANKQKAIADTGASVTRIIQPLAPIAVPVPVPVVPVIPSFTRKASASNAAAPTSARKASNTMIAVPDLADLKILQQRNRAASITVGGPAPKATPKIVPTETVPVVADILPVIPERPKSPNSEKEPEPETGPGPIARPATLSSWASIAGTLPTGSNIIDVQSNKLPYTSRLKTLTRLPSGPNPSKTEPLIDQMRVVFLLDIPTTLTLLDISNGLADSGPLRSIHFGIDEEKKSRFCAVVFQHATDAAKFTNVLLKERADSKPSRFKFIVDVVRGEDPYPIDDILRAMDYPTNASRRLTLVRATFFNANSKRMLRQKIEKIVGEGTIQLIWLYNAGNATIIFSDVGSAIAVKETFDKWASKGPEMQMSWDGLSTTFSRDPCVQALGLVSACPPEWNK